MRLIGSVTPTAAPQAPRPGLMPVADFARMFNAVADGAEDRERYFRGKLADQGVYVVIGRRWRKGRIGERQGGPTYLPAPDRLESATKMGPGGVEAAGARESLVCTSPGTKDTP